MEFSKQEFEKCLNELGLSQTDLAKLLSVTTRTVNRWYNNPNEITGPAKQALRAWIKLNNLCFPWMPDEFVRIEKIKRVITRVNNE